MFPKGIEMWGAWTVPRASRVPSLSAHKAAIAGPVDGVATPGPVVAVEIPIALGPVRPEVAALPGADETAVLGKGCGGSERTLK